MSRLRPGLLRNTRTFNCGILWNTSVMALRLASVKLQLDKSKWWRAHRSINDMQVTNTLAARSDNGAATESRLSCDMSSTWSHEVNDWVDHSFQPMATFFNRIRRTTERMWSPRNLSVNPHDSICMLLSDVRCSKQVDNEKAEPSPSGLKLRFTVCNFCRQIISFESTLNQQSGSLLTLRASLLVRSVSERLTRPADVIKLLCTSRWIRCGSVHSASHKFYKKNNQRISWENFFKKNY